MEQTQKKPKSNLNKNENFTGSSVTINATCMLMTCNMYQQCNVTSHLSKQTWECNEAISEDVLGFWQHPTWGGLIIGVLIRLP